MSGAKDSGVDDTPRETPSAKVSEGRLPKASVTQPRAGSGTLPVDRDKSPTPSKPSEAVRLDLPVVPRDLDTEPGARQSRDIKITTTDDAWSPPRRDDQMKSWRPSSQPPFEGKIYVRTFQARGVLGAVLVMLGFLIVLGVTVALFTLAIGVGAAVAAGTALAAIFGIGAARVRRALRARDDDSGRPSLPGE